MSARVAFLERSLRGVVAASVRLVGERSDDKLRADTDAGLEPDVVAQWLRDRLPIASPSRTLDLLCIDSEGSLCAWISSPSADPSIAGVVARTPAIALSTDGDNASDRGVSPLEAYSGSTLDSSVEPLATTNSPVAASNGPAAGGSKFTFLPTKRGASAPDLTRRFGVIAASDSLIRLLVDALDDMEVDVGAVISIWHAIARAWDPSGPGAASLRGTNAPALIPGATGPVIDASVPLTACVLVDPRGRVLWSWAQSGSLVAAGSLRTRIEPGTDGDPAPRLDESDVGRLASAWLAWSVQLGVSPVRAIVVVPDLSEEAGGLSAPGLGAAIARIWPGMSIDLAVDEDPIGTTLRRILGASAISRDQGIRPGADASDSRLSMRSLSNRPSRAHRKLYLWSSVAIIAASAGIGMLSWQLRSTGGHLRAEADRVRAEWKLLFDDLKLAGPIFPGTELTALKSELAKREKELMPLDQAEQSMPVLEELETLSYVIGLEDFELIRIHLRSAGGATIELTAPGPSVDRGEQLFTAISRVAGSHLTGWTPTFVLNEESGRVRCTFNAKWSPEVTKPATKVPAAGTGSSS